VLASVAALVAWGLLVSRSDDAPERGGPVPVQPTFDLAALEYQALRQVGVVPEQVADLPGAWSGPVLAKGLTRTFGRDGAPFPAGHYRMRVACFGSGQALLHWSMGGASGDLEVGCNLFGGLENAEFELLAPGEITLGVGSRNGSDEHASFAVALTDPRAVAAEQILGDGTGPSVLTGNELNMAPARWNRDRVGPGRYHLTMVCVGTGRLQVRLWFGPVQDANPNSLWLGVGEESTREIACSTDGAQLELDVNGADGSALGVVVIEIGGRPATSGYAFRVERVPWGTGSAAR
jgi:hypothetical protein